MQPSLLRCKSVKTKARNLARKDRAVRSPLRKDIVRKLCGRRSPQRKNVSPKKMLPKGKLHPMKKPTIKLSPTKVSPKRKSLKKMGEKEEEKLLSESQSRNRKFCAPTEYDPDFKGPIRRRGCTDIIFLFVFILFLVGWIIVGILACRNGDISRVIYPSDSNGNLCGVGNLTDKKYLFFFDITKCKPKFEEDEWIPSTRCRTPQVCVTECPTKTFSVASYVNGDPANVAEVKKHLKCEYGTDMGLSIKDLVTTEKGPPKCAFYYIASIPVAGRCFPSPTNLTDEFDLKDSKVELSAGSNASVLDEKQIEKAKNKMSKILNARKYIERVLQDISATWPFIVGLLVVAMILALIWIIFMRFAAGVMVWIGILAMLGLFTAGTAFSWHKFISLKGVPGSEGSLGFSRKISYYTGKRSTWMILGIISSIVLGILLLVIICLRERVRIAVALIKEAAKAIAYMPTALLFPLLPYILQLFAFLYFGVVALLLVSLAPSSTGGIDMSMFANSSSSSEGAYFEKCVSELGGYSKFNNKTCQIGDKALTTYSTYTHLYNLFGLFWSIWFIVAFGELTLAGAVASYYWARDKSKDVPALTVLSSMWMTTRYHLGSLAFGSLIISIVTFIRAILEYFDRKLKQYDNEVTKFLLCCCRCFCWCLENFLRFINKNSYIMIAIYGKNFCTSARTAFFLLMRNVVRVVVIDKVTDFLLFASKMVIVGLSTLLSYYIFSGSCEFCNKYITTLNYPLVPVAVVAIGSYAIATCFFDVYNMAVDTLFLCFLEDCERHDGSKAKPYFMSKELMLILKKKNVKETSPTPIPPKTD